MSEQLCTKCGKPSPRGLARGLCDNCYFTHRYRAIGYGTWTTIYTDPEPARQHINALRDLGIGMGRIAELADVDKEVIRGVAVGRGGYPPVNRMSRRNADKILAVDIPAPRDAYRLAYPGAQVPITGTRRRARALMRIGYHQAWICTQLDPTTKYGNRTLWTDRFDHTLAGIAARMADLFDDLQLTAGPSDRARRWATKQGWAPPLAWDEDTIDDSAAQPDWDCLTDNPLGSPTDFAEAVADHRSLGRSDAEIATRLGYRDVSSFQRRLYRAGIPIRTAAA